jgi:hypothetical protein
MGSSLGTGSYLRASSCRGLSRGTKFFSCMLERRPCHCCTSAALSLQKALHSVCIRLSHAQSLGCESLAPAPIHASGAVMHLCCVVPRAHEHDMQATIRSVVKWADRHKILPAPSKHSFQYYTLHAPAQEQQVADDFVALGNLEQRRHTCHLAQPAGLVYLKGSRWPQSRNPSVSAPPPDPVHTAHRKLIAADEFWSVTTQHARICVRFA